MSQSKSLQQQNQSLQQKNWMLITQLTQTKEKLHQLSKLNQTLFETLGKQKSYHNTDEIKLVIEGDLYCQRVIELQRKIQQQNNRFQQEVERRIKGVLCNLKDKECSQCLRRISNERQIEQLNRVIKQLKSEIFNLKLKMLETKRQDEVSGTSRILNENINLLDEIDYLKQQIMSREDDMRKIQDFWENKYNLLLKQHQDNFLNTNSYCETIIENKRNTNQPSMLRQIHNIVHQLTNRKSKPISTRNQDYAIFSIKDAINRPSKGLTFY